MAINAGSTTAATYEGVQYQADKYYRGGEAHSTTDPITGASDGTLFQTERFGSYSYAIPVTAGTYSIELHMAELYWEAVGERSFNVLVEGQLELTNLDLVSQAGHDSALSYIVENVRVTDGSLDIALEASVNEGTLSGFAVYSADGELDTSAPEPEPNPNCRGYVGITYDDGPNATNTPTLISQLRQHNLIPVTWFVMGQRVAGNQSLMTQMLSVGEIQNHSFTHPHMTTLGASQIRDELSRTNQAIESAGAPKPTLYRPPYGEQNGTTQSVAQSLGLRSITWDVDSKDWDNANTAAIVNAANQLQNGQVILMHDQYAATNNAVAGIASALQAKGLCPGRIDPATGRAVAP